MEVVNYLPGDQRLVDKIVYELKSQGIFDQFRKECFADVDTKPAYQNLRQRVEGNVTGFLKDQSWRPDMNKNQVREMLRKKISESGYLETGVERIVDQVVNPKINTIFLPKVEEVVYKFLGIQKPNNEPKSDETDLLPTDLEAVSPESKDNENTEPLPEVDDSKADEDESPPFEPLDEQTSYLPHEENSVDSHISAFSESNHSAENKLTQIEHDSQMSRNSSDSRLSIVTSDENSKIDAVCDDSQSKSIKSNDSKSDEKASNRAREPEKSRSSRSDTSRDKRKDSRSRYSSSSKDDKNRKSSTSSSSKSRNKSSSSKYTSSSRDRSKSESSSSNRDKSRSSNSSSSTHRDKSKSKSSDKYKHSSSSSSSHRKDTSSSSSRKKDSKQSKDDHYSSKEKKTERRSTDRDSNDGNSGKNSSAATAPSDITSQTAQKSATESHQNSGESTTSTGNSDRSETTKTAVNVSEQVESSEVALLSSSVLRISKPKFASNMKEAMKMMKIRKQLAKLEKKNQLGFASVDVKTDVLKSSSISLEEIAENGLVPAPLENTVISQDNWDKMEAKLHQEVGKFQDTECSSEEDCDVKYFERVELKENEFVRFVEKYFTGSTAGKKASCKRKLDEGGDAIKNNNNNNNGKSVMAEKKRRISRKINIDGSVAAEKFPLPLSPAESDASKEEVALQGAVALKQKRTSVNKASSQRYSSDDLYKPRPTFASSRRRGAKPTEEN